MVRSTVAVARGIGSIVVCVLLAAVAASVASAADEKKPGPREVSLTKRKDNGPYGTSAYSFRFATQTGHKNYVDLVFNGCGLLHISAVSGVKSRVTDLGEAKLDAAPNAAAADAKWLNDCFKPVQGHVYLQEIDHNGQQLTVKFRADEVADDAIKLTWLPVAGQPREEPERGRGAAGTMGQCGGKHAEK